MSFETYKLLCFYEGAITFTLVFLALTLSVGVRACEQILKSLHIFEIFRRFLWIHIREKKGTR
jgi:hypothetical protein